MLVIAAGVLMGLVSGVLLLVAVLIVVRRSRHYQTSFQPSVHFIVHFYSVMLRIARTMLSQDVCLCVCLPVCLSHTGILSKQLNVSLNIFRRRVATHSSFSTPNRMAISRRKPSLPLNASETVRDTDIKLQWIGTYTRCTRASHFEWPWMILSDLVK